jgi:hypothetical protein
MKLENPATCKVQWVTGFLNAKHFRRNEIHRQIAEVHAQCAISKRNLRKWCRLLKEGKINVHDEEGSGLLSLIADDMNEK